MKIGFRLLNWFGCTLISLAAASSAHAGITIYYSPSDFQAVLSPGSYLETFSELKPNTMYTSPLTFSSGGYSYNIVGDPTYGLFSGNPPEWTGIGNAYPGEMTEVDMTGATVTAVSLNPFTTDFLNDPVSEPITVTINGTTSITFNNSSVSTFVGFTDTAPITSLSITTSGSQYYTSIANLTVGAFSSVVPEPSSFALFGVGSLGALAAFRKRRAARSAS